MKTIPVTVLEEGRLTLPAEVHPVPAIDRDRDRVDAAMERIRARCGTPGRITAEEVLSARDEGRK